MDIINSFRINNLDLIYKDYVQPIPKLPIDMTAKEY